VKRPEGGVGPDIIHQRLSGVDELNSNFYCNRAKERERERERGERRAALRRAIMCKRSVEGKANCERGAEKK